MYNWDMDSLEDDYAVWLDEHCKCHEIDEGCTCMTFEEWYVEKLESAVEGMDEQDYAELYG